MREPEGDKVRAEIEPPGWMGRDISRSPACLAHQLFRNPSRVDAKTVNHLEER